MANLLNFNFNKLDLKLSNSDYWDFFLAADATDGDCYPLEAGPCLVVWYDFNVPSIYESNTNSIYSLVTWDKAVNTGYTLNTIGLTGIDNGLITFDKQAGDDSNLALLSALTGSTLVIPANDMRLNLNRVTGTTQDFVYPIDLLIDSDFEYANLCGGFYQGFYKLDGNSYEVLPTRVNQSWAAEFWVKPQNLCSNSEPILNDVNPNNKGFFFYMGARAENKFWNIWEGADTGCTVSCSASTACTDTVNEWCTIPKESEISIVGDYGKAIPLDPPQVEIDLITNGFLIYGRAHDGSVPKSTEEEGTIIYQPHDEIITGDTSCRCNVCGQNHDGLGTKNVCTYDGKGIAVVSTSSVLTNHDNPFLIYGRARKHGRSCGCHSCTGPNDGFGGETVATFSGRTSPETQVNYSLDVFDNALGFRITDDGRIGYRLLSFTGHCETNSLGEDVYVSGVTVEEGYSEAGIITPEMWSYVVIKFSTDYKDDCELEIVSPRKGKLSFYINGKLKYFIDEFDEFVARRLNEYKDKQIGVPFNISLGGGSQGLVESQTFDGRDPSDRNLYIEENFAGTFIGGISQFKFNICDLRYCQIQNNFLSDAVRYGLIDDDLLLLEDGFLMLLEDGEGIR